jgi:hypothetical protein
MQLLKNNPTYQEHWSVNIECSQHLTHPWLGESLQKSFMQMATVSHRQLKWQTTFGASSNLQCLFPYNFTINFTAVPPSIKYLVKFLKTTALVGQSYNNNKAGTSVCIHFSSIPTHFFMPSWCTQSIGCTMKNKDQLNITNDTKLSKVLYAVERR